MGDKSAQPKRGKWLKPKSDRGLLKRGKIWYIRYRANGKIRVEAIGPSKAFALKVYQKRKTEVCEGRFFPELVRRNVTFDEIARDAILRGRQQHEIRYPGTKFRAGRYQIVAEWFKGRLASSLTPQEIATKLAVHCKTPATYNRYRVTMSHAYKIAVENKKVADNPARLVKLQVENNERVRFLEPEEELMLREVIRKKSAKREPEFDLALQTGMRWSEQYGLRWEHVNLKLGLITISIAKSGRRERIPINSEARRALSKLRAIAPESVLVCPGAGAHRQWWSDARDDAKVGDFRWHDLRHTFASRLVMNGVDILTVNKLLRHRTLQVTMRYAHLAATHLHDAVEKLASVSGSVTVTEPRIRRDPAIVH
jgi:integrase